MVSLADKHLGFPVTFVTDDFDDEEDPVMYLLKECVKFVNHPHACEDVTTLQENFESARAICDMSWEMLNIGDWKDVPPRWRRMYSYGSLLKALCELGQAKPTEDVLNTCDMGLIMGAPVMGNILTKLASRVHKELPELISPALLEKDSFPLPLGGVQGTSLNRLKVSFESARLPIGGTFYENIFKCRATCDYNQRDGLLACIVNTTMEGPDVGVGYMAQHQLFHEIPELRDDICIPTYCCLSEKDEEPDINVWFGPEGTVSPLHHDPKNNILAQVFGEKYIRLYGKSQTPFLYAHEERLLENTSQVDVEDPDAEKFPLFEKAQYTECVLRPGEMLFIPPKCWHFVRSLSPSLSISFWWE
ncbi:bifunctional peptidase and arginyl-hydroxylase JMJD5-like isoform X4 [Dermacentor andersoni]|uniref:bifunctional peptidase and arginyl-hydroxylase JMJD5-like isoform X4 n=1 Tax=Dermacentor andersoni TaxID=34620 RepID=UPI002417DECF|nr:bifunctional peptidase and arginyl-hydroxylase JMJD5-like isoform X4 [Dermacentor andersoni]